MSIQYIYTCIHKYIHTRTYMHVQCVRVYLSGPVNALPSFGWTTVNTAARFDGVGQINITGLS